MNLADALIPKTYQDGDCIIKQGDAADGMYFVENGHIKITIIGDNGKEVEVREIHRILICWRCVISLGKLDCISGDVYYLYQLSNI